MDKKNKIEKAIEALKNGEVILIFDGEGREEETDLVVVAEFTTSDKIKTMRQDGGGLICTAIHPQIADKLKRRTTPQVRGGDRKSKQWKEQHAINRH